MDHMTVTTGYYSNGRLAASGAQFSIPTIFHVTLSLCLILSLGSAMWHALINSMLANVMHTEAWV